MYPICGEDFRSLQLIHPFAHGERPIHGVLRLRARDLYRGAPPSVLEGHRPPAAARAGERAEDDQTVRDDGPRGPGLADLAQDPRVALRADPARGVPERFRGLLLEPIPFEGGLRLEGGWHAGNARSRRRVRSHQVQISARLHALDRANSLNVQWRRRRSLSIRVDRAGDRRRRGAKGEFPSANV